MLCAALSLNEVIVDKVLENHKSGFDQEGDRFGTYIDGVLIVLAEEGWESTMLEVPWTLDCNEVSRMNRLFR